MLKIKRERKFSYWHRRANMAHQTQVEKMRFRQI